MILRIVIQTIVYRYFFKIKTKRPNIQNNINIQSRTQNKYRVKLF